MIAIIMINEVHNIARPQIHSVESKSMYVADILPINQLFTDCYYL
jgi:hypothetical protein